jgi:hypothetical protein
MSDDPPTDRESPVGEPVVRGDPTLLGDQAEEAVAFDPDDPDSVAAAADTVRAFAGDDGGAADSVYMLRGAAACAALVRAAGSYKGAAERVDSDAVGVPFVRKWARVHDLPYAVRAHVARGHVAPTAAKHVARLSGDARLYLAWATLDDDLTVREVRTVASAVDDGADVEDALQDVGVTPGRIALDLPAGTYLELRRRATREGRDPGALVADALDGYLER